MTDFYRLICRVANEAKEQVLTLLSIWPAKLATTAVGVAITEALQVHFFLLCLFAVLEFLDCVSKFIALSYLRLKDKDSNAQPTLYDCLLAIPAAHRAHYIQSELMRKQFFSKMILYIILISASGLGDGAMRLTHKPELLMPVVVAYISATELLSVLENLDDAGVSMAHALIEIVKSKMPKGGENNAK